MAVKLKISEVDRLPDLMLEEQHIIIVDDHDTPLLDVYDSYDLESIYATLDIMTDPDLLHLVRQGLEQSNNGKLVDVDISLFVETINRYQF